jgi:hypothetical protein
MRNMNASRDETAAYAQYAPTASGRSQLRDASLGPEIEMLSLSRSPRKMKIYWGSGPFAGYTRWNNLHNTF